MTDRDEHIRRLRAVRDTGNYNMFSDPREGLIAMYGEESGEETYDWVIEHFNYYLSGDWIDPPEGDQ